MDGNQSRNMNDERAMDHQVLHVNRKAFTGEKFLREVREMQQTLHRPTQTQTIFNLLATDFFFQILAHPVFKM